jgi:hypothetical protein
MSNAAEHRLAEIYLYDNGRVTRVSYSNGIGAGFPDINDAGVIVWEGNQRDLFDRQVFMLRDGEVLNLGPGSEPVVNNSGAVVWTRLLFGPCFEARIEVFDGHEIRPLSTSEHSNQGPSINDLMDVAWTEYHFCESPWTSNVLFHFDDATRVVNAWEHEPQGVSINNLRQVVWTSRDGLFFWQNGRWEQLTTLRFGATETNDRTETTATRWHEERQTRDLWVRIDHENGGLLIQLTEDEERDDVADINEWTEIAWGTFGQGNSGAIRLMRRIRNGESDFDGDVDLDDAASLHDCLTGPGDFDRLCDCRFLDIDHDRDVDLEDFVLFQRNYTGSK